MIFVFLCLFAENCDEHAEHALKIIKSILSINKIFAENTSKMNVKGSKKLGFSFSSLIDHPDRL